jgi:hypothetical protein
MRFYVAGRFMDYEKVRLIIDYLTQKGHSATYDWTRTDEFRVDGSLRQRDPHDLPKEKLQQYADLDLEGAASCEFFVLLADSDLAGAWVEMGVALASTKCKNIYVIAPQRWTIFLEHPKVRVFKNYSEWFRFIGDGEYDNSDML